jgi:histone RNA hairpin-binding protein
MKRGHGGEADDGARRQRRRYEDQPQANGRDKQWRPTLALPPPPPAAPDGGRAAGPQVQVQLLSEQKETDAHRLAQRQKQIDYGKNTLGYDRYCALVPRHRRGLRDPATPDKTALVGKKVFDRMVSKWRQALHKFDPPELVQQQAPLESSTPSTTQQQQVLTNTAAASTEPQEAAVLPAETKTRDAARVGTEPTSPAVAEPASRSIFDNFDEADEEVVDDDDDDDLL